MVDVNPEIIRWARETAGLTINEACKKLHIVDTNKSLGINRLIDIENGTIPPSRTLLLHMANQYHRPLLTFYLEKPPQKGNRGQDFRSMSKDLDIKMNAYVDALIREILARQSIIRSSLEEEEEIEVLPFVNSMNLDDGIIRVSESIIRILNFDITKFRKKASLEDAFSYLRTCVENSGIYVLLKGDLGSYHTSIGPDIFRGFVISDNIAPFIVINDKDSRAAWPFTLLHEITHLWLGDTGISNSTEENLIEQFCNNVAGEILLPYKDLEVVITKSFQDLDYVRDYINTYSQKNNLSGSMVAYRFFRYGIIDKPMWEDLNFFFRNLWIEKKKREKEQNLKKSGGPDFYQVHRYQNGPHMISTVKRMVDGGVLTSTKAGLVLGVKPKNVNKLVDSSFQTTELYPEK